MMLERERRDSCIGFPIPFICPDCAKGKKGSVIPGEECKQRQCTAELQALPYRNCVCVCVRARLCVCVPAKKKKAHTKQEMQLRAIQSLKLQNAIASRKLHACNSKMHQRLFAYLQGT